MAEFPPVTTAQWEEAIAADLKGADRTKRLVWRTAEGFDVQPYYREEDLAALKHLNIKAGEFPYVRGIRGGNSWLVRQTIELSGSSDADIKAANATALAALMRGVESVGFKIEGGKEYTPAKLDALLNGVELTAVELAFSGCGTPAIAALFLDKIIAGKYNAEEICATFDIDLLRRMSKQGGFKCSPDGSKCFEKLKALIEKAAPYKRIRMVSVGGHLFHDCGASIVQELAFTLAMGHEYVVRLTDMGLAVDQAAPATKFTMAVGTNYFMEIAKIRAARMLWANIINAYKPAKECAAKLRLHVQTSAWNQTVYDPYVNMLRGTTEAMSAAIAGVDSIEVLPFDHAYAPAGEFSSRIARNSQLLLKEESHFDQVTDPSGGSYYIETLTASIASEAWKLFRAVEDKGGYTDALRAGFIQEEIAKTTAARDKNIATRRQILLGTNQYPNFGEVAGQEITESVVIPCTCAADKAAGANPACGCAEGFTPEFAPLQPYRGAMPFEQLRLRTDRCGKRPKAFMLTCGSLAFARARAQFSCNFFACAGIEVVDNTFFASVEEGAKAALASKAEIVVLCAADDDYATLAPEAYALLKGKCIFVVAGAPASQPELEAAGITHFISVKSNVLETLTAYQQELGIK